MSRKRKGRQRKAATLRMRLADDAGDSMDLVDKLLALPQSRRKAVLEVLPQEVQGHVLRLLHRHIQLDRWELDPTAWMHERLGVKLSTLVWTVEEDEEGRDAYVKSGRGIPPYGKELLDAYLAGDIKPGWNGWDGTPEPIHLCNTALAYGYNVGMESGTGLSKTFNLARLILWFLENKNPKHGCIVNTYSTDAESMKKKLWGELGEAWDAFKENNPLAWKQKSGMKIYMRPKQAKKERWAATGVTPEEKKDEEVSGGAMGDHAENMLSIIDEMPKVRRSILAAIQQTAIGVFNPILGAGNPDDKTDPLHGFCEQEGTVHVVMSALDYPNVVRLDARVCPGATTHISIPRRIRDNFGGNANAPLALSRIRGICPTVSARCLFTLECIDGSEPFLMDYTDPVTHKCNLPDTINFPSMEKGKPDRVLKRRTVHKPFMEDGKMYHVSGETILYSPPVFEWHNRIIITIDPKDGDSGGLARHAITVGDRMTRRTLAVARLDGDTSYLIREVLRLAKLYTVPWEATGGARPMISWEINGVGANFHVISKELKRYPKKYRFKRIETIKQKKGWRWGWHTGTNRPQMVDVLRSWGAEVEADPKMMVSLMMWNDARTFVKSEKTGRYERSAGNTDDVMMAWAQFLMIDMVSPPAVKIITRDNPAVRRSAVMARRQIDAAIKSASRDGGLRKPDGLPSYSSLPPLPESY